MKVKKIVKKENEKKYVVVCNDDSIVNEFKITSKTIENKFNIIVKFLNETVFTNDLISEKLYNIFSKWNSYQSQKEIENDFQQLFSLSSNVFENNIYENINPETFSKKEKKTKKSLFIETDDVVSLIKLSSILKIYILFFYTTNNIYNTKLKNIIFNNIIRNNNLTNSVNIIYDLIKKKLSTFKFTDKNMWLFITLHHNKDYDIIINETFNFILIFILSIYEIKKDRNVISFIISFIESNMSWLFYDSYQNNVVLVDSLSEENSKNDLNFFMVDNLKSDFIQQCSYENTLEYITNITKKFFKKKSIDPILFETRINSFFITPLQKYFVLPVISKITNIEYKYLLYCNKYQIYILQAYLHFIFSEVELNEKYRYICEFLKYGIIKNISNTTSITLKKTPSILKDPDFQFYNLKNKSIFVKLITMVSSMTVRKNKIVDIFFETSNININNFYINQLITFYKNFFQDEENEDLKIMKQKLLLQIKMEKEQ